MCLGDIIWLDCSQVQRHRHPLIWSLCNNCKSDYFLTMASPTSPSAFLRCKCVDTRLNRRALLYEREKIEVAKAKTEMVCALTDGTTVYLKKMGSPPNLRMGWVTSHRITPCPTHTDKCIYLLVLEWWSLRPWRRTSAKRHRRLQKRPCVPLHPAWPVKRATNLQERVPQPPRADQRTAWGEDDTLTFPSWIFTWSVVKKFLRYRCGGMRLCGTCMQIALGQVQETEVEVIGVSEITTHASFSRVTAWSVQSLRASTHASRMTWSPAAHEDNPKTHQPPCLRGPFSKAGKCK